MPLISKPKPKEKFLFIQELNAHVDLLQAKIEEIIDFINSIQEDKINGALRRPIIESIKHTKEEEGWQQE